MILIILLSLACGVLGYEIVHSLPAYYFKRILFMDKEYPLLTLFSSPKPYLKLIEDMNIFQILLFTPLSVILMAACFIHQTIFRLLECQYCVSFWIGMTVSLLIYPIGIITFILPLLSMLGSGVYTRLKTVS